MNSEEIKAYRESLTKRNKNYNINMAYATGKNPAILNEQPKKDPDNRIPVPLAKVAVTDMSGYAGRAGDTQFKVLDIDLKDTLIDEKDLENLSEEERQAKIEEVAAEDILRQKAENKAKQDQYSKLLLEINEHNQGDLETSELYEESLTQGVAYELFWTSEDLNLKTVTPEYKIISEKQIVPVFTNDLKPKLSKAIRFWKDGDVEYADIYYPLFAEHWVKAKDADEYTQIMDGDTPKITEYPYTTVPLSIYPINRHKQSLFDAEKPLIDAHDSIISKSVNEMDRFNALIALLPGKVTKEFVDKLNEMKVIDDLAQYDNNSTPAYLEKNLQGVDEYTNKLLDRIERQFHKSIKIPDMTAESFAGGAQSGVAISYKLIGMEFKASQIDTYFDQGLNKRIELINDVLETSYSYVKDIKVKVTHKRNLPVDEKAKIEQALLLKGKISDEAYLRMLPKSVIPNVAEELERLELEPDRELVTLYETANKAGIKVPSELMALALRIDPKEWVAMTAKDRENIMNELSKEDPQDEPDLTDGE